MLLSPRSAFAPHRLPAVADKSCMGLTLQLMLGELPRSISGTAGQHLERIQTSAAWGRTNRSLCPSTWWQDRCPVPPHFRGFHLPPGSSKAQLGSLTASRGFERRRSETWSHQTQDKDRKCPVPSPHQFGKHKYFQRGKTLRTWLFLWLFFSSKRQSVLKKADTSYTSFHTLNPSFPPPALMEGAQAALGACPVLNSSPRGSSVT